MNLLTDILKKWSKAKECGRIELFVLYFLFFFIFFFQISQYEFPYNIKISKTFLYFYCLLESSDKDIKKDNDKDKDIEIMDEVDRTWQNFIVYSLFHQVF